MWRDTKGVRSLINPVKGRRQRVGVNEVRGVFDCGVLFEMRLQPGEKGDRFECIPLQDFVVESWRCLHRMKNDILVHCMAHKSLKSSLTIDVRRDYWNNIPALDFPTTSGNFPIINNLLYRHQQELNWNKRNILLS